MIIVINNCPTVVKSDGTVKIESANAKKHLVKSLNRLDDEISSKFKLEDTDSVDLKIYLIQEYKQNEFLLDNDF